MGNLDFVLWSEAGNNLRRDQHKCSSEQESTVPLMLLPCEELPAVDLVAIVSESI